MEDLNLKFYLYVQYSTEYKISLEDSKIRNKKTQIGACQKRDTGMKRQRRSI